jgi:ATP-dependent Clp protease ATP-binding subunit ClpA
VRNALNEAVKLSLDYSSYLNVVHLLIPLLILDKNVTKSFFIELGVKPARIVKDLQKAFFDGKRSKLLGSKERIDLMPSASFRSSLDFAINLMGKLGRRVLSEEILLLSMLIQTQSGTINFLKKRYRIDINDMLMLLKKNYFKRNGIIFSLEYLYNLLFQTDNTEEIESINEDSDTKEKFKVKKNLSCQPNFPSPKRKLFPFFRPTPKTTI